MNDSAKARAGARRAPRRRKRKTWTQDELREKYDVSVIRRPENEVLVVKVIDCCGERRMWYDHYPGKYEAHHWLVWLITKLSVYCEVPTRGLLEIPSPAWAKLRKTLGGSIEPCFDLEEGITYTIEADEDMQIVSLEEGDKLEEYDECD